jgi:hypothetical protein
MSTPERSQDPGSHGYGATDKDESAKPDEAEHPLEDPATDSRQDDTPTHEDDRPKDSSRPKGG